MSDPISPLASDLCVTCGLCCSGPIFNCIDIEPDEIDLAKRLGMTLSTYQDDDTILEFPCAKLVDKCCTVYEMRPSGCRSYRCELLKRLDRNEVAMAEAMGLVENAWAAVRLVEAELDDEPIRTYRRRRAVALFDHGEALQHTAARDRLNELDAILDQHFRKPEQNQTAPYDAVEGRDGWITVSVSVARSRLESYVSEGPEPGSIRA